MSDSITNVPETGAFPSSVWVRFLRSYGPTPNNLNLFDEYITAAVKRAKIQPLTLTSPQLTQILDRVRSGEPGSVLIAGTAGDGKTYHCRGVWNELGGDAKIWAEDSTIKELTLPDGRMVIFVKDLSELSDEQSDEILAVLENSALGEERSRFVVMAANHGQILERLRDLGHRQNRTHPLRKPLQDVFLMMGEAPGRLAVFDLSRVARRESLEEVLSAVAHHPAWDKCGSCVHRSDGRICPIYENRTRLLDPEGGKKLSERLGHLVEIARQNGWHLPVRDLLALASNMILGHPDVKENLMVCNDVPKLQVEGKIDGASIYSNVFGANLPKRRAMERPVFKALSAFGVGDETSNGADGLLVYGADDSKLVEAFERLIGSDTIFGATSGYKADLLQYLEGDDTARQDRGADQFVQRLVSQRRRMFFTLPEDDRAYPFWSMTAFRFGGDYLDLMTSLVEKKTINESIRARLVRGLNRVMTGLLIENTDRIFVASSGGFSQSRISVLCDTETSAKRDRTGAGMTIRLDQSSGRPSLDIALAAGKNNSSSLLVTPIRFEFLCRVAEGALPGSFSNECLEDMLAFKAKLLRKAEVLNKQHPEGDDGEPFEDDGALMLKFIDIEKNGHGFSRSVTVRVDL